MTDQTMKRVTAITIAGATLFGAVSPVWSAPVLSNTAAVIAAAPSNVTDVRYGGRRYYRNNNGAAVALGVLGVVGAVAAASAYRHNSYRYGYAPGYYQQGYYGNPYYAPGYGRHYSW